MSLTSSPCDFAALAAEATRLGIDRVGVATAEPVPPDVRLQYRDWIGAGCHGHMSYLEKYDEVRSDPRLLLEGARTVISCAVSYYHVAEQPAGIPRIASYAHGDDYHEVVRARLESLATYIRENYGGDTRVCVDTAPIHERYWAVKSGVAIRGDSGLVIVPGLGTYCFLGEIISTATIDPTAAIDPVRCNSCGKCKKSCPGGAIKDDGTIDARRCLSYLTIEYRGELPPGLTTGDRLYGCDTCQQVCHYNSGLQECGYAEFDLREAYKTLSKERIMSMDHAEYVEIFRHSAIKRTKLDGLKRNAQKL